MRIAHLMLFNFYIDDAFYQENILPRQNKADGHEVLIIASTHVFGKGNSMTSTSPRIYFTKEAIKVIRVPYKKIVNEKITKKIRAYKNVYFHLEQFKPDVIFSHGIGGYESKTIAKFVKNNPATKLYIDCHSDFYNSATNFISKYFLHRIFYRHFFWKYEKFAKKVYYVAPESIAFLKELYGFNDQSKMEFLPLGGFIIDENEIIKRRKFIRKHLNILESDIIFIHTGKLDVKKKSSELINAFTQIKNNNIKLLIVGTFSDDVYSNVKELIDNDERIKYLGWKTGEEVQDYLCASDVYMQPGSRTVTVQNAACCGCAIITNRSMIYTYLFGKSVFYAETEEEVKKSIEKLIARPFLINKYKKKLLEIAKNKLDYKKIANAYL
ncbi:MAG: glycosyltransferase family 4 protein [Prolixibacteraceae bacterium]|nr:glycosyltransferase family 4 protein [Prolixibacteraceae bacterium]